MSRWLRRATAIALLVPAPVCAEAFLQIAGIPGEATDAQHSGWIQISGFFTEVAHSGRPSNSASTHFGDVVLIKGTDASSPHLFAGAAAGSVLTNAILELIRPFGDRLRYYRVEMEQVIITGFEINHTAGAAPRERIALNPERIRVSYWEFADQDRPEAEHWVVWDLSRNKGQAGSRPAGETNDNDQDGIEDEADPDDDNDGMSDTYELACGLDPWRDDHREDKDGDGMSNLDEFRAGTCADESSSVFRFTAVETAGGSLRLTWRSARGKTYTVSVAAAVEGPYTPLATVPSAGNGTTSTSLPTSNGRLFFSVTTK